MVTDRADKPPWNLQAAAVSSSSQQQQQCQWNEMQRLVWHAAHCEMALQKATLKRTRPCHNVRLQPSSRQPHSIHGAVFCQHNHMEEPVIGQDPSAGHLNSTSIKRAPLSLPRTYLTMPSHSRSSSALLYRFALAMGLRLRPQPGLIVAVLPEAHGAALTVCSTTTAVTWQQQ